MKQAKVHLSLDRRTGNFWVDMGLVVLVEQFGEGEHAVDDVLKGLLSRLIRETGNQGEYYDEVARQPQRYNKKNWIYPANLFIKVSGSAPKTKVNGREYFTRPPTFELKLELSEQDGVCDLCRETAPLTKAKMWMYPFLVDPQKFATFYPGTKRGLQLCARCALAGLAGYLGWLWKAQGRDALHFFVFHSELPELTRFYREVLGPLREKEGKGGNAPAAFSGPYIHETALGLLLALFAHVRESYRLSEDGRELLARLLGALPKSAPPLVLYAITGKPGKAFQMQVLREFSNLHALYRLYEGWMETLRPQFMNPHNQLVRILEQFRSQQGKNVETIWRDRIARAILEFGDPFPHIEAFLFEVRVRANERERRPLVGGSLDVLNNYLKEVLGMEEKFQRVLAGFGHGLGEAAHGKNEMGLLYALRNARNPEDFFRVLNDAQFRLKIIVPEQLLQIEKGERIQGVPWLRVKTLLSIYAMNAFLRKGRASTEPEFAEETEVQSSEEV